MPFIFQLKSQHSISSAGLLKPEEKVYSSIKW